MIPPISINRPYHPPQPSPVKYVHDDPSPYHTNANAIHYDKYLPQDIYLPKTAITLDKADELALRKEIYEELYGFDPRKLKDIYFELSGFDNNLTGYITFQELSFCLMRNQVSSMLLLYYASKNNFRSKESLQYRGILNHQQECKRV